MNMHFHISLVRVVRAKMGLHMIVVNNAYKEKEVVIMLDIKNKINEYSILLKQKIRLLIKTWLGLVIGAFCFATYLIIDAQPIDYYWFICVVFSAVIHIFINSKLKGE